MKIKDILSIIFGIVAISSLVIFIQSAPDISKFTTALWSGLIASILTAVVLVWNPWLIGK